ncbi:hypothetical protein BaRGS_00000567 [Batillaria attramentaria]|uniref:Uncharacterized protein n=1 Tax=Batillaria attramentaria TaxID=370345 RepID=A0ABD0M935_9CAEN
MSENDTNHFYSSVNGKNVQKFNVAKHRFYNMMDTTHRNNVMLTCFKKTKKNKTVLHKYKGMGCLDQHRGNTLIISTNSNIKIFPYTVDSPKCKNIYPNFNTIPQSSTPENAKIELTYGHKINQQNVLAFKRVAVCQPAHPLAFVAQSVHSWMSKPIPLRHGFGPNPSPKSCCPLAPPVFSERVKNASCGLQATRAQLQRLYTQTSKRNKR